jgi:hypothetical protein
VASGRDERRQRSASWRRIPRLVVLPAVAAAAVVAACGSGDSTTEVGLTPSTTRVTTDEPATVPTFQPDARTGAADLGATTVPVPAGAPGQRLGVGPCPMFPADNSFNTPITGLPVSPDSNRVIAAIGPDTTLRHGFSSTVFNGTRRGYPLNLVDPTNSTPTDFMVSAAYLYFSDGADVPMPEAPRFEGWPGREWDKHLLLVDTSTCRTRELLNVQPPGENDTARPFNKWYADAIVEFDLRSNGRPEGSANAAGVSMLAGLVRYDEVASGRVRHAIGLTMPEIRGDGPIWPAHRSDGRSANPDAPPMGAWFRLRDDVDTSTLGPQARVVAEALREYGGVLVDTGPGITLTGEPDVRWNDADLNGLGSLTASDLELVDPSSLIVDPATNQARVRG